jgi:guanylate kinase
MGFADRYDHVIVNDDADRAVTRIERILQRARRRRSEPAGTR